MRLQFFSILASAIFQVASIAGAGEPVPQPKPAAKAEVKLDKQMIRFPEAEGTGKLVLRKGQYYGIASSVPLVIEVTGKGQVEMQVRKLPLMLPTDSAVGLKGDVTDPEFVTFQTDCPFIYLFKPIKNGKKGEVNLKVIPGLNRQDEKGVQVPLTLADIQNRAFSVDAEGAGPDPGPDPGPGPGPDVDPETPDELTKAIAEAYKKSTDTDKAESVVKVAKLYRDASKKTVYDKDLVRVQQLNDTMREATNGLVGESGLSTIRAVINAEAKKILSNSVTAVLDQASRDKASELFLKVAKALEALK